MDDLNGIQTYRRRRKNGRDGVVQEFSDEDRIRKHVRLTRRGITAMRFRHALSFFVIAGCSDVQTEEKDRTLADPPASGPAEKLIGTPAPEPVAGPPEALFGSEPLGRLEAYPLTDDSPTVRVSPVYPPRAAEHGVEGNVVVVLLIDRDGTVQHAEVISSEPPGVFERSALKAVRSWRYPPRPRAERTEAIKIVFEL